MAASPQVVTSNPLYLNARTLVYTAQELRKPWGDTQGVGVQDYDSFRIRQRAAGANMSIDAVTASVLNRAFVRGSTSTDQGMYRVDYNSATPINVDIATSDPTNPRIDQVYLAVEDQQATGTNNQATIRVVTGTATAGATLDNRTGVGATPAGMSSILLADVLVAAAATSIANAAIRDRRPFGAQGAPPTPFTALDQVTFIAEVPANYGYLSVQNTASADSQQSATLMYLPRRIVNATRIRWNYIQGSTANTGNYNIGIHDASTRLIASTGAQAYTGTTGQMITASLTITAQTFDAGYYWISNGAGAGTAGASVLARGVLITSVGSVMLAPPNTLLFSATGGTTLPTTLAAFTDQNTITAAAPTFRLAIPIPTLSVG